MISKAAILERAAEWQLTSDVVEKDYVLGWLLAGIAHDPRTRDAWVFKGGTCLKKCVLETYRFSEDLDFTLLPGAAYAAPEIEEILRAITIHVTTLSGIAFPADGISIHARKNLRGSPTFEVRVGYVGPMAIPGPPKIRFDLSNDEAVIHAVDRRPVFHPYPDLLPAGTAVASYATAELIAEKTRALAERTRPRDLYDVVLLGENALAGIDGAIVRSVAHAKFKAKGLRLPTVRVLTTLAHEDDELRADWEQMLAHQLPVLPLLDDVLARLPAALAWLDEPSARHPSISAPVSPIPTRAGESAAGTRGIQTWGIRGVPIEAVRFAGANRLLIEFDYHGATRIVEPYALRRPATGNLLLYGFERKKNGAPTSDIRAYKVTEIQRLRVTQQSFVPRYAIELSERPGVWRW